VLGLGGLLALRKEHELFVVFFTFGHSLSDCCLGVTLRQQGRARE